MDCKKGYHSSVVSLLISAAAYAIEIGPPLILPAVQMRLIATI